MRAKIASSSAVVLAWTWRAPSDASTRRSGADVGLGGGLLAACSALRAGP